jgi:small subunit ribosomal protein S2
MKELPGGLVVVDIKREYIAVKEAKKMGIPVVALVDTDCDPGAVDIPIPGNDDAYRSIQAILKILADAVTIGRRKYLDNRAAEEKARIEAEAAKIAERARAQAAAAAVAAATAAGAAGAPTPPAAPAPQAPPPPAGEPTSYASYGGGSSEVEKK